MDLLQIVGYTGSFLIALSLTMNNLVKLRWINLFGAATFACYGYIIDAYPVMILNSIIALTDLFYLGRMYRQREYFDLLKIEHWSSPYLKRFLRFYMEDAKRFFPKFSLPEDENLLIIFVMRNLKPAGLFIGQIKNEECHVLIDYVTPEFRDLKGGHFLMETKRSFFSERGVKEIVSQSFSPQHERYLLQIGFDLDEDGMNKVLRKNLFPG